MHMKVAIIRRKDDDLNFYINYLYFKYKQNETKTFPSIEASPAERI